MVQFACTDGTGQAFVWTWEKGEYALYQCSPFNIWSGYQLHEETLNGPQFKLLATGHISLALLQLRVKDAGGWSLKIRSQEKEVIAWQRERAHVAQP